MKYEMIFGDEALFDGAPDDVDMIGYNGGFYKNSKDGPMYCCGCTFTTDEYRNKGFIAMRRIIKEPKRWTWEDKKAGRLPEVGTKAMQCHEYCTVDILSVHHGYIVVCNSDIDDSRPVSFEIEKFIELFNPIETKAEKAQRLEYEFVKSEMKDTTLSIEWACIYERGVRAAYRKLKGGE